ncbi:winged helix-turn-helix domain-containing protein [Streptomyces sp. NPDC003717]|uniref:ArsR/SmtB family transcription factor n=1 Tax=Streptomyces sp. NPDC003717 TaxID=3154276 RepID=UPI0033A4FB29
MAIHIRMTPLRLARTRFALSPTQELTSAVLTAAEPTRRRGPTAQLQADVRALIRDRRLRCLAAVARGFSVYLPEFLTPPPHVFDPPSDEQLHQVATTDARAVADQVDAFVNGGAGRRRQCPWLSEEELTRTDDAVRAVLETHGSDVAEHLTRELDQVWRHVFLPHWGRMRGRLELAVERHGRAVARTGMSAALPALHHSLAWQEDSLAVDAPYEGVVDGDSPLLLVPSFSLRRLALCSPYAPTGFLLVFPLDSSHTAGSPTVGPVLGHTREALLGSLTRPRTTTELAHLHHLRPSTVSYHIGRLRAADLVSSERRGRHVYHRATVRARILSAPR